MNDTKAISSSATATTAQKQSHRGSNAAVHTAGASSRLTAITLISIMDICPTFSLSSISSIFYLSIRESTECGSPFGLAQSTNQNVCPSSLVQRGIALLWHRICSGGRCVAFVNEPGALLIFQELGAQYILTPCWCFCGFTEAAVQVSSCGPCSVSVLAVIFNLKTVNQMHIIQPQHHQQLLRRVFYSQLSSCNWTTNLLLFPVLLTSVR